MLECKDAKELTELLYASNDRNRYYNYGFPFKEGNEETILMTGYGQVDSPIFSTLEQVQKYFLEIYTEDYCKKHWFWTGESPRWKEMDGILFQSYADGMYFPVTETIFYKGIMPSEKVLDFPVDCNTLTGSVNL